MLRWLQYVLSGVAVIAIAVYAGSLGERWVGQAYLDWQFTQSLERPALAAPPNDMVVDGAQPLGRLEIPSIDLSALFIEGVDGRTLRRAVGHIPGTALPGMPGNVALSAHRDTFFRRLRELDHGDVIWITTLYGRYKYVVESSQIVPPEANGVLRNLDRPTLTLVTCYPFYYVGPAPKRFVVHAVFAGIGK
ncbi:MAG TPA: class D sortase [Terriglobia bacterium]|nr:class D sortase [Terriglobia bacterium]